MPPILIANKKNNNLPYQPTRNNTIKRKNSNMRKWHGLTQGNLLDWIEIATTAKLDYPKTIVK